LVEWKTLVAVLLIAAVVLGAGYAIGRFSTLEERVTTTVANTLTTTMTSTKMYDITSTKTFTKTKTETTVPQPLPTPANSSAIVSSQLLMNDSLFLMVSMDKSVYMQGETVHFKGTLSNLTPDAATLYLLAPGVRVYSSSHRNPQPSDSHKDEPWYYPPIIIGMGPPLEAKVTIGAGTTVTLKEFTTDWNMTGIHEEISFQSNIASGWIAYDDHPLPPGKYYAEWGTYISSSRTNSGNWINQTAAFEIIKSPAVNTTQPSEPPPAGTVKTTTVTVTRTTTSIFATSVTTTVARLVTTTSVSTHTLTETLLTTDPSAGQKEELPIYVWAVGATAVAVMLGVVMLLRGRKT
jgi:hypothetical protein